MDVARGGSFIHIPSGFGSKVKTKLPLHLSSIKTNTRREDKPP
jgi:hypothetical protein